MDRFLSEICLSQRQNQLGARNFILAMRYFPIAMRPGFD